MSDSHDPSREPRKRSVARECPLGPRVLAALARSAASRPAGELLDHLVECAGCRELALVYRASLVEARTDRAAVPSRVERAVLETLARALPRSPAVRRRSTFTRIAVRAVAAGVLFFALPLAASQPFFDRPVRRIYAAPAESWSDIPRLGGERVWLHTDLLADAHLHALLSTTFDDAASRSPWTTKWLEPGADPRDAGPIDLLADLPGGALRARLVLLATGEPLRASDLDALEALSRSGDDERVRLDLSDLARRTRGTAWCEELLPALSSIEHPSLGDEMARLLERKDASGLRAWTSEHPLRARAAVAMLLERALDEAGDGEENLRSAELVLRDLAPSIGTALEERVAAYRRWASSPAERAAKEDLDRRILRDARIHDENLTPFRVASTAEECAAFYAEAARHYEALGDPWGRIESLVRQAWFEPDRAAALALCDEVLRLSGEHAYPVGEAQVENLRAFWAIGVNTFEPSLARAAFTRAFELLSDVREWEIAAIAASNLGFHLTLRGAVGEALPYLAEAARIQEVHGFRVSEALTLFKLSWAHREVGRSAAGAALAERALHELRECDGPAASADFLCYLVKAHAYASLAAIAAGRPERALELRMEGEAADERMLAAHGISDTDALSRLRNAAARALLESNRVEEALEVAIEAERTYEGPWQLGMARFTTGIALRRLGRAEEALEAFQSASRSLGTQTQARLDWLDVLHAIAELQEERGLGEDAVATRLAWLDLVEEVLSLNALSALDQAFLRERFRPGFVAGVRLAALLQRSDRAEAPELALRFMEGARPAPPAWREENGGRSAPPLELAPLRARMAPGTLWLEYLHGAEETFLLAVDSTDARILELEAGSHARARFAALEQAIGARVPEDEVADHGRAAFDALLGPAAPLVRASELLLVSPDPGLWVPTFEVFVDAQAPIVPGAPAYLLLEHAIAYVPSARFLPGTAHDAVTGPPRGDLLAIRCPPVHEIEVRARSSSSRELEEIARIFANEGLVADVRDGLEHGLATLREGLLSRYRYVHILADAYESSALELANDGATEPALLGIGQIADLPPLDAELVVLASGGSMRDPSGAASRWWGLPGAFLFRGARSVVVDLGGSPPRTLEPLLAHFYQALFRSTSMASALREAKLALPREDPGRLELWSSLVLIGDPR